MVRKLVIRNRDFGMVTYRLQNQDNLVTNMYPKNS